MFRHNYVIELWSSDNELIASVIIKARSEALARKKLHKLLDKLQFCYNARLSDYYIEVEEI